MLNFGRKYAQIPCVHGDFVSKNLLPADSVIQIHELEIIVRMLKIGRITVVPLHHNAVGVGHVKKEGVQKLRRERFLFFRDQEPPAKHVCHVQFGQKFLQGIFLLSCIVILLIKNFVFIQIIEMKNHVVIVHNIPR